MALENRIDARFAAFESKLDARFSEFERNLETRFASMETRLNSLDTKIDSKFSSVVWMFGVLSALKIKSFGAVGGRCTDAALRGRPQDDAPVPARCRHAESGSVPCRPACATATDWSAHHPVRAAPGRK